MVAPGSGPGSGSSADTVVPAPSRDGSAHSSGHQSGHTSHETIGGAGGAYSSGGQKSSGGSTISDRQQMAPGTVLAGRYRIVAPIGRGGMGQVYRAEDLKLGETVALKFLPDSLAQDAAWLGRFFMEVRTAREVTHPNVCRVHDVVETTDSAGRTLYFLTMEYVDGENLADLVRRFGRLPTEKGMEIAGQITAGLAAAHEKGVLHRDIKPANVLIDGRGQAKLADFGLAVANNAVQAAEIAGTPGYIAPEILRGGTATGRSDLYSLGLVLYELLTGRKAVKDGKAVTGSVRQYAPDVPVAAEKAVLQCVDPDPAKRPASAAEVMAAFPAKNALEAALARGETPSPEMVADSADETPMPLRTAWAMVGAVCVILVLTWFAAGRGGYMTVKPPQLSPDEMRGRAQQMLRDFGYSTKGTVQLIGMEQNFPVLDWYSNQVTPEEKRHFAASPQGSVIFSYQQSQSQDLLATEGLGKYGSYGHVFEFGQNMPATEYAVVDSEGNLLKLFANPEGTASTAGAAMDWAMADKATGVDTRTIVAQTPEFTPPFAFDERRAWTGSYPGHPESRLTFEAASWHGRLNYLRVSGPWDWQQRLLTQRITVTSIHAFEIGALVVGFVLALYNLRRNRGDVRSATRLAVFLLMIMLPVFFFGVQHQSHDLGDYTSAFMGWLSVSLVLALFIWLAYIAIEPLTRKRVPQLLVASSLILQGRWRSPRVGKEILIGSLVGVGSALWWQGMHALEWGRLQGATLDVFPAQILLGLRGFITMNLLHIVDALDSAAQMTVLFTLFVVLFRNKWIAFVLLAVEDIVQEDTRGALLPAILVTMGFAFAEAWLFVRVGLVAVVTAFFVSNIADCSGWAREWSNWLMPETLWSILLILGITTFGFWLAIGGQKPFGDLKLEE